VILNQDLWDENKYLKYKVGDVIDVVVVKAKGDEVRVTRRGSRAAPAELENLEDAYDMELPLEGKITEVVNGGYRLTLQGQSAFCPFSQIDSKPVKDPASMVGKKFQFLITQLDPRKRNIVVSRRRLLDLQKAENEGRWMEQHQAGDILPGEVSRLESYGAFVDLGEGIDGLVHISEIGFIRLKHAADALHVGDKVQVKILKIEDEGERLKISLSVKQAGGVGDPWLKVPQDFPVGTVLEGRVEKKESFGLFVSIAPGITGLLPKSKWRDSAEAKDYEHKKAGDTLKVRVDEIKFEERKISLGLPTEEEDLSWKEYKNTTSFGSLASAFSQAGLNKPAKKSDFKS
jgi:small subunit ribosomal protein S1